VSGGVCGRNCETNFVAVMGMCYENCDVPSLININTNLSNCERLNNFEILSLCEMFGEHSTPDKDSCDMNTANNVYNSPCFWINDVESRNG
jgi:hypothetical protein